MHELLTIQLGHRANFLATHFWNAQETYFTYEAGTDISPIDHDIHYRPGVGTDGEETYTPRTLIYDLKGGFGGLRKLGGLYDQQLNIDDSSQGRDSSALWDGSVVRRQDPPIKVSDYQRRLDEGEAHPPAPDPHTVRYWSDFNRIFYHPRSVVQINDYELSSSLMPFEGWASGQELFSKLDSEEDLLDRDLRPWAEECDQMQGMQIWSEADNAWGGFSSKFAERIRDEYGKIELWVWGIQEESGKGSKVKQMLRTTNTAHTIHEVTPQASMYIPLSLPATLPAYAQVNRSLEWHVAAVLSSALETATLPSRLRTNGQRRGLLSDISATLNKNGDQGISELHFEVLDPSRYSENVPNERESSNNDNRLFDFARSSPPTIQIEEEEEERQNYSSLDLDMDLSSHMGESSSFTNSSNRPRTKKRTHFFGATVCLRSPSLSSPLNEQSKSLHPVSTDNDNDLYRGAHLTPFSGNNSVVQFYTNTLLYPVPTSFPPSIFSTRSIISSLPSDVPSPISHLAVKTSLTTSTRLAQRIGDLARSVSGIGNRMMSGGERENLREGLEKLREAYVEGWESGDESDDDDM